MASIKIRLIRNHLHTICTHNYQRVKLSTGIKLEEKYWDAKNQRIRKNHPFRARVQMSLDIAIEKLLSAVQEVKERGLEPTAQLIRKLYNDDLEEEQDFFQKFEGYIQMKSTQIAQGTINNLTYAMESLRNYHTHSGATIMVESFNRGVVEKWINHQLLVSNYRDETIHKHVKKLKEFLRWAEPDKDFSWIKYKLKKVEEPLFLLESELEILMSANLKGYLAKSCGLFVFCCITGMRYSDTQRFSPLWLKDGVIEYRMKKTGGKAIVPLFSTTHKLLHTWCGQIPKISQQKFNDYLKILFKRLELNRMVEVSFYRGQKLNLESKPLHKVITSHVARKTFITLCLMKGIPIQDVMKMSGHSDYDSMKPYIAITNDHLKEVAKKWDI